MRQKKVTYVALHWKFDPKVDEVVTVKTSCVVVESAGVPQVTFNFPPCPP